GGTHADDDLDELRSRHREERRARLAGDGAREERLARPGRPAQEDAARDAAAELLVLLRVSQEVDDLGELELRLVDPRDLGECDHLAPGLVELRTRPPERAEHAGPRATY